MWWRGCLSLTVAIHTNMKEDTSRWGWCCSLCWPIDSTSSVLTFDAVLPNTNYMIFLSSTNFRDLWHIGEKQPMSVWEEIWFHLLSCSADPRIHLFVWDDACIRNLASHMQNKNYKLPVSLQTTFPSHLEHICFHTKEHSWTAGFFFFFLESGTCGAGTLWQGSLQVKDCVVLEPCLWLLM